ncbi:MAG: single-stranded-DNA-specific exonuclease RecJ [Microscillaceae bacterium]|jgi:single-stranded-DNA-specific exonuclease|nr:single-stranded-DNA-specific exonuclease RecJ [Microscillaceae bacterium]
MEKRWIYKTLPKRKQIESLAQAIQVDDSIAAMLVQRGITSFDTAKNYFRPSLDDLHDPFLMKGMEKAVERLEHSIAEREKVLIYGDYDVDGTTSIALVYGFLQGYHPYLDFYVPDRHKEGYGISKTAIDWAAKEGFKLIIALDCGIKSVELTDYAGSLGIDFIICDHHLPGEQVPEAYAVLDPKQPDCSYPFKELSGCGIGFKLMQAFCEKNGIDPNRLYDSLDLLVVSIASDIVPIVGENRILAYYGLQKLNHTPRIGLKALMKSAGFTNESLMDIRNLVFGIGPRINAVGRLQHARQAVELLIAHDSQKADEFAEVINQINTQRQSIDAIATQEALAMLADEQPINDAAKATVVFQPHWHKGVLGIMAARLIEQYHRPTIVLTEHEGRLTGSGRSVPGFNLYEAIAECADLLEEFGGHHQAAGLTLTPENLPLFKERFYQAVAHHISAEQLIPPIEVDLKLRLDQINAKFYRILKQMAPFGPENMRPIFVSDNLQAEDIKILKEKHLKFKVRQHIESPEYTVIGFGMGHYLEQLQAHPKIQLCYSIEENYYQGKTTLQLRMRDLKFLAD